MKPLVDQKYLLEKYPGKGGWTYAMIPEIPQNKKVPFGWVKVKGTIDGVEIKKFSLMPMGNGHLFLPVKAEIRKKIKKEAGDWVHVILFPDNEPLEIPDEMMTCLEDEPKALQFFTSLIESEKKFYLQWIYSAKKEETKINRMAKAINKLSKQKKFHAPSEDEQE